MSHIALSVEWIENTIKQQKLATCICARITLHTPSEASFQLSLMHKINYWSKCSSGGWNRTASWTLMLTLACLFLLFMKLLCL